jgi:hypothetical protein
VIGFLLVRPGPSRTDLSYAAVAAGRDAAWIGHLIECAGYGLAGFGLAVAACIVVQDRGAAWANVGAVLIASGGVLFAAMGYAVGVLGWYATETAALPAADGSALLAYLADHPAPLATADVLGFVLLSIGTLLICVAFWRSRALPSAVPITIAALTLGQFIPWPDRLFDVEQAALMASFLAVAWYAGQPHRPVARPNA